MLSLPGRGPFDRFGHDLGEDPVGVHRTSQPSALEQYQGRYTHGAHSSFMLKFSGEVTAT
jgi:hypothetical protein